MPLQETRNLVLTTPLGKDTLLLQHMTAREELGRPFEYRIVALSEDFNLELNQLLGESVTVSFDTHAGEPRHFNGLVSHFSHMTASGNLARYELVVRPWLWFLTRNSDCRIFQDMSVPEIITQVFRDRGFSDFDDRLAGNYRTLEYCVQYRETDFNFVSRLMEQEGIYYFFKHTQRDHTLVLSDGYSSHENVPSYATVPYFPRADEQRRERDHIFDWCITRQVQPGKYAITDFDFKNPSNDLLAETQTQRDHALSAFEIFDYPGEYVAPAEGQSYVEVRNEELHAQYARADCSGNARGLSVGALFTLEQYPRDDQNIEHLIVSGVCEINSDDYQAGGAGEQEQFRVRCTVMDARAPFRPARNTPRPTVQGPQTALVVGKAGEEIWCDEYGRVKVQFHWDRYGASDETSSCWVRVSQAWAGGGWGAMHIPRIGHEVIVDFLEGDPDRPIITGRVYNGENMPHYALPANQSRSGIISRSTKGAGTANYNEIRFEDKKGEEEMYLHAEKDQNTTVENDQAEVVQHDKTIRVDNDRSESIGRDRTLSVGRDKSETIARNKTITVGKDHTEGVQGNMSITIAQNLTETVAVNYSENVGVAMELTVGAQLLQTVGANMSQSVGASQDLTVGGNRDASVGGDFSEKVGGDASTEIGKDYSAEIGGKSAVDVGKEFSLKAKKIELTASDQITLKTGSAELVMKKNGDILLKGKKITVKGSGDVILKGSKVTGN